MIKRIVSGVFILVALGALGTILARALADGEQLIVRFLIAIIVAALGLYVISDLRMQANAAKEPNGAGARQATPATGSARSTEPRNPASGSTAAFMESVTARKPTAPAGATRPASGEPATTAAGEGNPEEAAPGRIESTPAQITVTVAPSGSEQLAEPVPATVGAGRDIFGFDIPGPFEDIRITPPAAAQQTTVSGPTILRDLPGHDGETPYPADDELASWPNRPGEIPGVAAGCPSPGPTEVDERDEIDELVAMFARKTERDLERLQSEAAPTVDGADEADEVNGVEDPDITIEAPILSAADHEPMESREPGTVATPLALSARLDLDAAAYTHAPIAPIIDLRSARPNGTFDDIEAAIRSGEIDVISSLIEQGLLSTEGPISDRDVRTMVYVAFTSNELRKILLAGGVIDGDNSDLDLGRVEMFPPLSTTTTVTPIEAAARPSGGYDQRHQQAL